MNLEQDIWKDQLYQDSNAVILDVRTEDEFNEGYIPGAINIDIYKGLSNDIYEGLKFIKTANKNIEVGNYFINDRVKAIVSEYETIENFIRVYRFIKVFYRKSQKYFRK